MNIPKFAVNRPLTVTMIFIALVLFGLISLQRLPIDMLPEMEVPVITVIVPYPGASAEDVERDVVEYLENELVAVPGLDDLRSYSRDNMATVMCEFDWGVDIDVAANDVRDKVDLAFPLIRRQAPDVEDPILYKFSTADVPVMVVSVTADESWPDLYNIVDEEIAEHLLRVDGVGSVQVSGGLRRRINVDYDREKLRAYGISPGEIVAAISRENIDMPAGDFKLGRRQYFTRVAGRFESVGDIEDTVIGERAGIPFHIKDVAAVEDGYEEITTKSWADGREAVSITIWRQHGANTVDVAGNIRAFLDERRGYLPADADFIIPFDGSDFISSSIANLTRTLFAAALLVVVVTLVFIRKLLASLIVSITIPVSLIMAFIMLYAGGFTINIISLMSLAVAVGMVVDNAIVMLENTTRHLEKGEGSKAAPVQAAGEVGGAIVAATLTTISVFVALAFVGGFTKIFFEQLAYVVSLTLVASLLAALSLTPVLCSKWLKPRTAGSKPASRLEAMGERGFARLEDFYSRRLEYALSRRRRVVILLSLFFFGSLFVVRFIGTDLFPQADTGDISINFSLSQNARLEETEDAAVRIMNIIEEQVPERKYYYADIGAGEMGFFGGGEGINSGEIGLKLVPVVERERSAAKIAGMLRGEIGLIPGIEGFSATDDQPYGGGMGDGKAIEVEITGDNIDEITAVAGQIEDMLEGVRGAVAVESSARGEREEVWVRVDRRKAARLGVSVSSVADTLRTAYYGAEATRLRDGLDEFDIFVRMREDQANIPGTMGYLAVPTAGGGFVELKNVAEIHDELGSVEIERKNRSRIIRVGCDVYERSLGEVLRDIEQGLAGIQLPAGVGTGIGGDAELQRETFSDMFFMLVVGVLLVYMVMASQFESLKTPFIIFFALPFTFTGVGWALFITGTTLNLMSFVALITLMGVVVNNAIVMVSYTNILKDKGKTVREAVMEAGRHRLRPVLMTSFATMFGMLPLAVQRAEGAELWRPFGITVIGGMLISTIITLVLVPIVYSFVEKDRK